MRSSTRGLAQPLAAFVTAASVVALAVSSAAPVAAAATTIATRDARPQAVAPGVALSAVARPRAVGAMRPGPPGTDRRTVGGRRLAGRGIIVSYRWHRHLRLPDIPASAWMIASANTGAVLAAKDPHGLFPPASTLKVLTAITMLPRLNPDATVLATRKAASVVPNIVGLIPGHRYRVADLFRALLLISANDAAVALVQAAGSFTRGMALLNAEAHHLQAYDVVAKQPNGLPARGQVVSAYDLALIARRALAIPAFMRYDATLSARFPVRKHQYVTLANQNYLLTQYRGGIGGKIGWTMAAEATYIGLARRNGQTLIVTVLHATPLTEITSAERLLDWGFAMRGQVHPVGVLVPPLPPPASRTRTQPHRSLAVTNSLPHGGSPGLGALVTVALGTGLAAVAWALVWRRRRAATGRHQAS